MAEASTTQLQLWVERMKAGDAKAADALLSHVYERLSRLTRKMLHDYPGVQRWEQSSDVLHNAALRLLNALRKVEVTSSVQFYRLAAVQIRRELIDLARHYYGPEGSGANHATDLKPRRADSTPPTPAYDPSDSSNDPGRLALWTEFHERVESLPEKLRAVFDLVWYHDLQQPEVAALLGISLSKVKRDLAEAKLHLMDFLDGFAEN
jgi:RNA polymerase sigma-70 factor (ECF subfamily)